MMKKIVLCAGLAFGISALGVAGHSSVARADADADAPQNFSVVNKTGHTINNLYVSAANVDNWEEDILGEDQLKNGDEQAITFHGYKPDECEFDIKITDTDSDSWVIMGANLCTFNTLTFHTDDDGHMTADYK